MSYEIIILTIIFGVIQFLSSIWIKSRLESSIKHEYDEILESFKEEREVRHKAALVAEFLAEWTHPRDSTKRLNQLLWELSLYLPADFVKKLNQCVSGLNNSIDARELIVSVRNYLLKSEGSIVSSDIQYFNDPANNEMRIAAIK